MGDFIVSARKYRPQTFDTVVGQKSITSTLRNAIKNDHLAQAFLFCGSRGVGKTSTARILAKTINCFDKSDSIEACDKCDSCESFNSGASLNVYELDAASNNSVEDIRSLIDQVRIAPQLGTHKVYIIDEVHMLSTSAFNAFLKTLEEPPKHAIFILATTEKHKIIPTILSRCQIFDFNRIKVKDIADHLGNIAEKEGVTAEKEALHIIAQKADGALRDALSIFDQVVTFSGNNVSYESVIENLNILDYDYFFRIIDCSLKEDIPASLLLLNDILEKGFDQHNFIVGLADHFRNLLVCKDVRTADLLEVGEAIQSKFIEQSKAIDANHIVRALGVLSRADVEFKASKNQRLLVEMALMQLCSISKELEKKKRLTDLVKVIPFPDQGLRDRAAKKVAKPVVKQSIKPPVEDKKPKVMSTTSGKLKSSSISIKKLIDADAEVSGGKTLDIENMPMNDYSFDDFKMAWRRFAFQMKDMHKETFYNALIKRDPVVKSTELYVLEVDNAVQVDYIFPMLSDLVAYIRAAVKNYAFNIKIEVTSNPEEEVKYLTGKDKFASLARKNPNLHTLKNTFNLDIEF